MIISCNSVMLEVIEQAKEDGDNLWSGNGLTVTLTLRLRAVSRTVSPYKVQLIITSSDKWVNAIPEDCDNPEEAMRAISHTAALLWRQRNTLSRGDSPWWVAKQVTYGC